MAGPAHQLTCTLSKSPNVNLNEFSPLQGNWRESLASLLRDRNEMKYIKAQHNARHVVSAGRTAANFIPNIGTNVFVDTLFVCICDALVKMES